MFNWNCYLVCAKRLAASDDEADLRSAISRAYYAAFHTAMEFCRAVRIPMPYEVVRSGKSDTSQHSRVIVALQKNANAHLRDAGLRLASLRTWRNSADYRLPFDGSVNAVAQQAITSADRIIEELDRYCREV